MFITLVFLKQEIILLGKKLHNFECEKYLWINNGLTECAYVFNIGEYILQDIKTEIKTEQEECDKYPSNELEHIYIKSDPHFGVFIKTTSKVSSKMALLYTNLSFYSLSNLFYPMCQFFLTFLCRLHLYDPFHCYQIQFT